MASKIRYLQEYKLDREQLQIDLIKYKHQNDKMKKELREVRDENREVTKRVDRMKEAMLAYDHEVIEEEKEESYLFDQLLVENAQLRRLLMIEEGVDCNIGDRIKALEDKLGDIKADEDYKMPEELKRSLETRQRVKETERMVSLQMRKMTEQEILKEAERQSRKSRQPDS